ncbi:hypothetical protein JCM6882_001541 [Rhodosporidiobolus microsporus]
MQSARGKSVVWDPTGTNRFLVGGGSELRLYELNEPSKNDPSPSSSASASAGFTTLSVLTELTGLRAFAWNPYPPAGSNVPVVAAGLATGRVLLLGLEGTEGGKSAQGGGRGGGQGAGMQAVQINVRHSRPCNCLAFSPSQPGLLAVGLEKGRGESLLVYDVQRSLDPAATSSSSLTQPLQAPRAYSLSREHSQPGRGRAHSPATTPNSPSSAFEPVPLVSFGSSEAVTSCAFLAAPSGPSSSSTSPLLAAAMANKWLRVYDLRSPPQTVTTWGTRAVHGISANPFNAQQFSSHGDDGVVRLWDLRKPMDPLLQWSEADAGATSKNRSGQQRGVRALVETAWSTERRGVFATLEKEAAAVRVWQLADGPGPRLVGNAAGGASAGGGGLPGSPVTRLGEARAPLDLEVKDVLRMPVLLEDKKTRPFQQSLSSFAFAPSSSTSSSLNFIGVSRDTSAPGSSGHRLELVDLPSDVHVGFLERGLVLSTALSQPLASFPVPAPSVAAAAAAALGDDPDEPDYPLTSPAPPPALVLPTSPRDRGRTLSSLAGLPPLVIDRNQTPRPSGGMLRRVSSGAILQLPPGAGRGGGEVGRTARDGPASLTGLSTDISAVLRERIEAGYGGDAAVNAALSEGSVREFWEWIARAQFLSSDACFADYDFRFRGVLRILLGFPSGMTNPSLSTSSSASSPGSTHSGPSARASTPRSIYSDISRSLRRNDETSTKNAAYAAACAQLVERRRLDTFAISSSQYAAQRKIALASCGAEWEEGWEAVCTRLQKHGEYEAAARHAFFSGQLEKSMYYLRLCKDENLRMLAPIVAAYLAQKDTHQSSESNFTSLCRTLSSDVETPWVRAMFAFLATSDWRELVDETGLPLKDRVAVALRFLSDSELIPFLTELGDEALSSSDLEAVVLFGLRNDGLKLLGSYIDRTSDVQTVALACSFTSPGLIRADLRVQRWIETYRSQLDQFRLYAARAMFDAARGRRARAALEQAKVAGRNAEAKEVAYALRKAAPPQIMVRCQFCGTSIKPPTQGLKGLGMGEGRVVVKSGPGAKGTTCPSCSKQLPACCICLLRPSVHSFEVDGPSTLAWCQKCRHGGHAEHVLAWFETSNVCAVADCSCECNSDRRS